MNGAVKVEVMLAEPRGLRTRAPLLANPREPGHVVLARLIELRDKLDRITELSPSADRHDFVPELGVCRELGVSVALLSIRRIGALIAVERGKSLEDYSHAGVLLDARLSSWLLLSLFFPGSPLHDGAAILRNNQILAAGCLLPLFPCRHITGSRLGARHQAALQLSLDTDALALLVSEETGRISVAFRGRLFRETPSLKERIDVGTLAR